MYAPFVTECPDGFVMYQEWPEYNLAAEFASFECAINLPNRSGIRKGPWPLVVDVFYGDTEPDERLPKDEEAPNRAQFWLRTFRQDVPKGWRTSSSRVSKIEGFADIREGDCTARWSDTAKRHRNKWHREFLNTKYSIEDAEYAIYKQAYLTSTIGLQIHSFILTTLEKKLASSQGRHIELKIMKDLQSGRVVAGMAVMHSPTYKASYYQSGFYVESVKDEPVMVGLFEDWFVSSKAKGYMYLHLGNFWMEGNPASWKGFSQFKTKFGTQYIAFPPDLSRFKTGKFLWL